MHDLKEGHGLSLWVSSLGGLDHRSLHVGSGTSTAWVSVVRATVLSWLLVGASWLLADEFALWTWAESWLLALPVALGLLAHWCADGVWCGTSGTALGWGTDSLTLRAVLGLAEILWTTNVTLGLITVNLAGSTWSLLAVNLTTNKEDNNERKNESVPCCLIIPLTCCHVRLNWSMTLSSSALTVVSVASHIVE